MPSQIHHLGLPLTTPEFHCKDKVIAWFVTLSGATFFFYEFIQMNMFNSLSLSFEKSFTLTALQLGVVSAFYFIADSILLYPAGVLVDRFSSRRVLIIGMLMCIGASFSISCATNAWFLVLGRMLAGTASAFCLVTILRLASQWFPMSKMAEVTGVVITFGMIGGAVSQTPLVWLIHWVGWRHALQYIALMGVVFLVLIVCVVKDAPKHKRFAPLQSDDPSLYVPFWAGLWFMMKNKYNWLSGMYIASMNLPIMILAGLFGTQYLVQADGFTVEHASSASMMIFIGTIVGSSVFGFLTDRLKQHRMPMLVSAVLAFILFVVIIYLPHLTYETAVILFFLLGLITAAQIIGYPVARETNPQHRVGSAMGFISVMIMGAAGLLQPVVGWALKIGWDGKVLDGVHQYTVSDYRHALWVLVLGFVVSIYCAWRLPETYAKELSK
jgi:MFS family permease